MANWNWILSCVVSALKKISTFLFFLSIPSAIFFEVYFLFEISKDFDEGKKAVILGFLGIGLFLSLILGRLQSQTDRKAYEDCEKVIADAKAANALEEANGTSNNLLWNKRIIARKEKEQQQIQRGYLVKYGRDAALYSWGHVFAVIVCDGSWPSVWALSVGLAVVVFFDIWSHYLKNSRSKLDAEDLSKERQILEAVLELSGNTAEGTKPILNVEGLGKFADERPRLSSSRLPPDQQQVSPQASIFDNQNPFENNITGARSVLVTYPNYFLQTLHDTTVLPSGVMRVRNRTPYRLTITLDDNTRHEYTVECEDTVHNSGFKVSPADMPNRDDVLCLLQETTYSGGALMVSVTVGADGEATISCPDSTLAVKKVTIPAKYRTSTLTSEIM